MLRKSIIAVLAALALPAQAQVLQSGSVVTGHVTTWATNGVVQDGGTAGNGSINALGLQNTGTPFCINDAPVSGQYHQFCLGANSLGGGLISYNAYGGAPQLPLQVNINGATTTIGTGTINSGTQNNVPYYSTAGTGTTLSADAYANLSNGAFTLGSTGSVTGNIILDGATSGAVTIEPLAAAGTYNFILPNTAGTAGQVLTSQGGGSSAMTWTNSSGSVITGSAGQFAYYPSSTNSVSGSSVLSVTGSTVTVTGGLTVSPSGAPTITFNPATTGTINNVTIGNSTAAAGTFTAVASNSSVLAGIAGTSLGSLGLSGNSSGTITIQPQAAAGTYNFNLPITVGSSGQPLLSAGGGSSPMTWGTLSGNTSEFGTVTGAVTSGHVATWDASGNLQDGGSPSVGTINSGTGGQLTYYAGSGTTVSGNGNLTVSSGALTVGVTGATAGSIILSGSSTGAITIAGSSTTIGTYNFNLPTTAGTSGHPMLSGGGGAAAMTWGTISGNTTKFGTVTGALVNGDCIAADASGNLIDNGSTCGTGGSGTVTSSTATQVAYYPSSTNAVAGNSSLTISGGAVTIGVTGTTAGTLSLSGSSTGTITIQGSTTTIGTYNFNLPTTAGSAGQVLTSQGGGSSAMTWSSSGVTYTNETSAFNCTAGTIYTVDTTGGAVTMTLPASPNQGDVCGWIDAKQNFASANFTVARNGKNIANIAADLLVNINTGNFKLAWDNTNSTWNLSP